MLTPDRGPMVIEWNCRFGDPETQAVLVRLEGDLLPWLLGAAEGRLPAGAPRALPGLGLCIVLAAAGYPGEVRKGDAIEGLDGHGGVGPDAGAEGSEAGEVLVFHAGTRLDGERFVTAGGRVLGVTTAAPDLVTARRRAYAAIDRIRWAGVHYRKDIGLRGQP
jgi:phosphoribosylamine---glycine ligase